MKIVLIFSLVITTYTVNSQKLIGHFQSSEFIEVADINLSGSTVAYYDGDVSAVVFKERSGEAFDNSFQIPLVGDESIFELKFLTDNLLVVYLSKDGSYMTSEGGDGFLQFYERKQDNWEFLFEIESWFTNVVNFKSSIAYDKVNDRIAITKNISSDNLNGVIRQQGPIRIDFYTKVNGSYDLTNNLEFDIQYHYRSWLDFSEDGTRLSISVITKPFGPSSFELHTLLYEDASNSDWQLETDLVFYDYNGDRPFCSLGRDKLISSVSHFWKSDDADMFYYYYSENGDWEVIDSIVVFTGYSDNGNYISALNPFMDIEVSERFTHLLFGSKTSVYSDTISIINYYKIEDDSLTLSHQFYNIGQQSISDTNKSFRSQLSEDGRYVMFNGLDADIFVYDMLMTSSAEEIQSISFQ